MGITYVTGRLRGPTGHEATLEFLVDSGAVYSLVPDGMWQSLELEPLRREAFPLADGTRVERDVGECWIELDVGRGTSPVILGEPGDDALLGAVTLQVSGLVLNPFSRTLHPMRARLVALRWR